MTKEQLQAQADRNAVDILKKLCDLKHYKDDVGKDTWYEENQPKVWAEAFKYLESLPASAGNEEMGGGYSPLWVKINEDKSNLPEESDVCIWSRFPVCEPPHIGSLIDFDPPPPDTTYYTHYMKLTNEFFDSFHTAGHASAAGGKGLEWVRVEDGLPKSDHNYFVKVWSDRHQYIYHDTNYFERGQWSRINDSRDVIREWLDEAPPSSEGRGRKH
jgi:hypothetical protein